MRRPGSPGDLNAPRRGHLKILEFQWANLLMNLIKYSKFKPIQKDILMRIVKIQECLEAA